MTPWALTVLVACAVGLTAAAVATLLAARRMALRAERVLAQVEHEVRPMASELEGLLAEVRDLTQRAGKDMERISGIVRRAEDVSVQAARLAQALGGFTKVGQAVALLIGIRRGANVFVKRLKG